jgi:hypothetical protein
MKSKPLFLLVKKLGSREFASIRRSDRTIQNYLNNPLYEVYKVGKKLNGARV